jgi:peroxiredoxin
MGQRFQLVAALALIAAGCILSHPAQAEPFVAGDRPSEVKGRNIWTDKVISTEDYRGKWLLVDFFATWCGPCMGELPNLIKETKDLRGDNFEVLGISLDAPQTADHLKPVLKKAGAKYPMIYQGGTWKTPPATEWGVRAIPASYLIDPQGVVVATNLRGDALRPLLEFFLNHPGPYPAVNVDVKPGEREAGNPLPLNFYLDNPRHTPLKFEVTVSQYVPVYAADDPDHKKQPVDFQEKRANGDAPDLSSDVDCSKDGSGTASLTIPVEPDALFLEADYRVQLPDSVDSAHPDGVWMTGYFESSLKQKAKAE